MNIGLVAHDSKKTLMQNFCIAYRGILSKHELYATGTTGRLIEEVTNLNVHKYLAGPLGGKEQLGAQIAQNDIDALIFLREPKFKVASSSVLVPTLILPYSIGASFPRLVSTILKPLERICSCLCLSIKTNYLLNIQLFPLYNRRI